MVFDFKKEEKIYYSTKKQVAILNIPTMNFLMIDGKGDPNEEDGEYANAVKKLYTLAYTIRMSNRNGKVIEDFFTFVVAPLEGFWWQEGIKGVDSSRKDKFSWQMMLRIPEFVSQEVLEWAQAEALSKKKIDTDIVHLERITEGLVVQMLHVGPYDDESKTAESMHRFMEEKGYTLDVSDERKHHEIYLSDPRRSTLEKLKTILRHPIK